MTTNRERASNISKGWLGYDHPDRDALTKLIEQALDEAVRDALGDSEVHDPESGKCPPCTIAFREGLAMAAKTARQVCRATECENRCVHEHSIRAEAEKVKSQGGIKVMWCFCGHHNVCHKELNECMHDKCECVSFRQCLASCEH